MPERGISKELTSALEQRLGADDVEARELGRAHVAALGEVRLIGGRRTSRPNETAQVVVDASGALYERAEVAALAGRDVFEPGVALGPVGAPVPAREPVTIEPSSNDWTLNRCDRAQETIAVTIPKSGAAPKADVYLLADTTGSMSDVLSSVAAASTAILGDPAFAGFDVAWGVGNYRDFPVDGVRNSYAFQHQLSPTTVVADAVAAVGAWAAAEGSDGSEGQLHALDRIAGAPAIGWRADAKRIVVWMGDAPGHDPICAGLSGLGSDVTEASATAALTAAQITVVAIGTATGMAGDLDGDPNLDAGDYAGAGCTPAGTAGQATRIAAATGGSYTSGLAPADVVARLVDLITAAVTSIGNVHLSATGDSAEFVESITPAGGYGPLPGDHEHVLSFDVTWRGTRPCGREPQTFTGTIDVVADGVVVASKPVRVTVPPCRHHYPVTVVCGPQGEGDERCVTVEPGHYATLVTIYNPSTCPVVIEKRFAPIAVDREVLAREPRTQAAKRFARLELGPGEVTMDDCCALREAVGDVERLIGVLDIVASGPLDVTVTLTTGHGKADDGERARDCAPGVTSRVVEPRMAP